MLLRKIEIFLDHNHMPPTKFGLMAVKDPRFVFDLRNGREPQVRTERRVEHFMNKYLESAHVG